MPSDFDFLQGSFNVVGASEVAELDGVHQGLSYSAGSVSVDETTLAEPGRHGLTFRIHEAATGQW